MVSILIIGACSVNKPGDIVLSFFVILIIRIIKSCFLIQKLMTLFLISSQYVFNHKDKQVYYLFLIVY
jgi:hypothetical protein